MFSFIEAHQNKNAYIFLFWTKKVVFSFMPELETESKVLLNIFAACMGGLLVSLGNNCVSKTNIFNL